MKKVSLIIFVFAVILIITGSVFTVFNTVESKKEETEENTNRLQAFNIEELKITMCQNEENCPILPQKIYNFLSIDYENNNLQKVVDTINKKTKEEYEKALASDMSDASCASLKSTFKHSLLFNNDINLHEDEEFFGISVHRYESNLCTEETIESDPEIYIFSRAKNDFISQEELKARFSITDEQIEEKIKENIEKEKKDRGLNYTFENVDKNKGISLYFSTESEILAYYYQQEDHSYHTASILEI